MTIDKKISKLEKKYRRLNRQMRLGRKACLNCKKIADIHFPLELKVTATFPAQPSILNYSSQQGYWLCNNCYLALRPTAEVGVLDINPQMKLIEKRIVREVRKALLVFKLQEGVKQ